MNITYTLDTFQCYEILGLKQGATIQEIKQAYRELALRYHPDKDSTEGSQTRFSQIADAYQTLRMHAKKAAKIVQKFDDIYPEDAVLSYEQAQTLVAKSQYEEAIPFYDKALERLPRYANAWLKKGDALYHLKRHKDALLCYGKVLQINPESADAWNLQGICLSDLKRYEEALESFDEATILDPAHGPAWNFKGVCFFMLGRLEMALDCFERATKNHPEFAVAWHNKGGVLMKMGKKKEAEKCYEKAEKLRQ
ncbi:MAG: tetratricopeptide repeat protein [Thaumarchaeota archaeon]|nr:tetratricopeptide repeat protein [Nitrososphaerota archaeon]